MIAKAYATLFFNKSLKIPVPLLCMNNLLLYRLDNLLSKKVLHYLRNSSYKKEANLILSEENYKPQ